MGKSFIHSVLVEEQDPAADAVLTHNLPVNPLSGLLLELKPLNESSTITTYQPGAGILDALNAVRIRHLGRTIIDASGRDLWAALLHRWHRTIGQSNQVNTDNDRRSLILPIMFGRHWGDPDAGIPATRSGELIIELDLDVADTGYDDFRYQIETLELPGASFGWHHRLTTIAATPAATGNFDVDLPQGQDILGLLLFGTTEFAGATPAPTFGRLSVLKDNVQTGYSSIDWERLAGLNKAIGTPFAEWVEALVSVNVAASTETDSRLIEQMHQVLDEYAYLDYDPTRDGMYALDARGAGRLVLRADTETADALRVMPIERVSNADFFRGL